MKVKWLALLLVCCCLSVVPAAAETQRETRESDGFSYTVLEDGSAEIVKYIGKESFIAIPDTLDGHPVTSIGNEAFYLQPGATGGVTIPDTVKRIGSMAFALSGLESVEIPAGVTAMGDNPFGFCDRLAAVTVAEGNPVFYTRDGVLFCREDNSLVCYPNQLTDDLPEDGTYRVPEGTEAIRGAAFGGVEELGAIELPEGLKTIGRQAFGFCMELESIVIPDSVTEIGEGAFDSCQALRTAALPAGLTRISPMLFYECGSLESVNIPETVTEIGAMAFQFCEALPALAVPDSVTDIGEEAFFTGGGTLVITCGEGSFAKTYCEINGVPAIVRTGD